MKKRLPPLNWLRVFEASARHLNFTQAANELSLTQAAISQQIKALESQLGTPLFKRLPRGLELTDAGQAYLPVVHEAIERLIAATDELFGQGRKRQLTVRVNLVFFTTWLAARLGRFRERYPDINLHFTSNIWHDDQAKEADLEIRYGRGAWPGMRSARLTRDELFPVCSPALFDSLGERPLADWLAEQTLLHVIGYEDGWGYWLNQTGEHAVDASQGMRFDTLITALEMAKAGQGLALGRTSLVRDLLASDTLIAPPLPRVATSEAFYLVAPAQEYNRPEVTLFWEWLVEEAGL